MERIEEFVDERQKAWCLHCARTLAGLETSEDHVPTKSLLNKPRPHHLPVVEICRECNVGFSRDEQYAVAFLGSVVAGSTDPTMQRNASAARTLAISPALRAVIDGSRVEEPAGDGVTRLVWRPDLPRIERVVLKNARGHAFFEFGEPMLHAPDEVAFQPLEGLTGPQREAFEVAIGGGAFAAWPEVGSRMMTRIATGLDFRTGGRAADADIDFVDGWVVVQEGAYRYSVDQDGGGVRVRTVWWEYLATEVRWAD